MARRAEITRDTNETKIRMTLNLDGTGQAEIHTGIGFFDHMLHGFARHGLFDLEVSVEGDLEVDTHHTIEDAGIVLGKAIREAAVSYTHLDVYKRQVQTQKKLDILYEDAHILLVNKPAGMLSQKAKDTDVSLSLIHL